MDEPSDEDYLRLGQTVRARRKFLGLRQADVAALGGPSTATLREIEGGKPGSRHLTTFWQLERILGWRPGSANKVLRRDAPDIAANPDYRALHGASPEAMESNRPQPLAIAPEEVDWSRVSMEDLPRFSQRASEELSSRLWTERAAAYRASEESAYERGVREQNRQAEEGGA